jgi:uncharacterized protein with NAD-binding domain and iron-sulfur cluster
MANKKRIAVLGGGIGALSAAFELTCSPNAADLDITVYQMGWRLGGKCATARGPNARIEEHGIHGFLGSYYNALPVVRRVYEALDRPSSVPIATFEQAFKPESFVLMWEYQNGGLIKWPFTAPRNDLLPSDPASLQKLLRVEDWLAAAARMLEGLFQDHHDDHGAHAHENGLVSGVLDVMHWLEGHTLLRGLVHVLEAAAAGAEHAVEALIAAVDKLWQWIKSVLEKWADGSDTLRRLLIVADFMLALIRGTLADRVAERGFDVLDNENFADWLARHGASPRTISSPMSLNTVNLSYQYPNGDTTRAALMGAGCYLHWTLRSFAYMGAFAWLFEAGTGETVIAPMYEALKKRGVKFEFFHKVETLHLNAAKDAVASIDFGVQATLKSPGEYQPLISVKNLPSWPGTPLYDQLNEGTALQGIDLESYWNGWQPVAQKTLQAGQDFDTVVFGISIGAVPYLCGELLAANPAWATMCEKVTTVQTQTMQLWLKKSTADLGWDIPLKNPTDCVIGATYLNPIDGSTDFTHLLPWEDWPEQGGPKSLWYFSGAMDDYETPPPFTDTDYPKRAYARVKAQCIQYLGVAMGPLLPNATTNANSPPGDPMSLDFSLLHSYNEATAGVGAARFNQQFWRANIDPTERYVTSPPGSTAARIKASATGFSNLVIAGDWPYTGLNVGSVEGTVMGGRLASNAVCGFPALSDIPGYPTQS